MATIRLVLSGGSAKGIPETLGAATAVLDRGHEISVCAGTSAGGIVAVALAAGIDPALLKTVVMDMDFSRFVSTGWLGWWRLARRGCLSNGRRLLEFLERLTFGKRFRDAAFDVRITGADYSTGQLRVFSRATDPEMPLALAARITSAMPLAFSAIEYEGHWYKDGGVYAHVPVEAAVASAGRMVIFALASPPPDMENLSRWRANVGIVREVERAVDLLIDANVDSQLARAPGDAVRVFSDALGFGTFDFALSRGNKERLFDHGRGLVTEALERAGL